MLLIARAIEAPDRTQRTIIFHADRRFLANIETDFGGRRKAPTLRTVRAVNGFLQRRIGSEIPAAPLFVDDRTEFPRPGVFRKRAPLVTDFRREAQPDRPLPIRG